MKEGGFHAETRAATLRALDRPWDLLVVGGGINGCGIALEAARQGYEVLLLERSDLGSGTSGRSSRLIHGGLRYLKYGHARLVLEASLERHRLRTRFPHLVQPLPFVIPVYDGEGEGLVATSVGLALYDLLAGYTNVRRHERLGPQEVLEREPGLRSQGLRGGGVYYDCWTDDARLVLMNAQRAHEAGARLVPYAEVTHLLRRDGRVTGAVFRDRLDETVHEARARLVVNATGPWSDGLRALASRPPVLRPTKGVHLLLPRFRVGNRHAVVLRSPRDGRVTFVLPWRDLCLVGTTDTDHRGPPDEVRADESDVDYLLETVNHGFPGVHVGRDDVVSTYAALRPLVANRDVPESEVPRDHRLLEDAPGLLSLVGGKLTTYRRVAEKVVRRVRRSLGPGRRTVAHGAREVPETVEGLRTWLRRGNVPGLDEETVDTLVRAYGPAVRDLLPYLLREGGGERILPGLPYRWGQVAYAVDHEMALRLTDVLARRTRILQEDPAQGRRVAPQVADVMGDLLGWDPARRQREREDCEGAADLAVAFRREA